ncbi:flagellar filament capping protein FliD [Saccharolobus shibatae]|nr:flagellar filament capping protein FliD [Saccharolobus shibatae]
MPNEGINLTISSQTNLSFLIRTAEGELTALIRSAKNKYKSSTTLIIMLEEWIKQLVNALDKFMVGEQLAEDERIMVASLIYTTLKHLKDFNECNEKLKEVEEKCNKNLDELEKKLDELRKELDKKEEEVKEKLKILDNLIKIMEVNPRLLPKN